MPISTKLVWTILAGTLYQRTNQNWGLNIERHATRVLCVGYQPQIPEKNIERQSLVFVIVPLHEPDWVPASKVEVVDTFSSLGSDHRAALATGACKAIQIGYATTSTLSILKVDPKWLEWYILWEWRIATKSSWNRHFSLTKLRGTQSMLMRYRACTQVSKGSPCQWSKPMIQPRTQCSRSKMCSICE